jgi:hypothetical protein
MLQAALLAETGDNLLLDCLIRHSGRPTARQYREANWGDPEFSPYEDEDEQRVIAILEELDELDANEVRAEEEQY